MGYLPYQLVQDFFHQPYLGRISTCCDLFKVQPFSRYQSICKYIPDAPCMDYLPTLGEKMSTGKGKWRAVNIPYMEHLGIKITRMSWHSNVKCSNPAPPTSTSLKKRLYWMFVQSKKTGPMTGWCKPRHTHLFATRTATIQYLEDNPI